MLNLGLRKVISQFVLYPFSFFQASEELEDRESLAVMAASGLQQTNDDNDEAAGNGANDVSGGGGEHEGAGGGDASTAAELDLEDGMDFMEQYTQGVSAVETILALDRLRQSVAVKELLRNGVVRAATSATANNNPAAAAAAAPTSSSQQQQQSQFMRKTVSVPNFSHVSWKEWLLRGAPPPPPFIARKGENGETGVAAAPSQDFCSFSSLHFFSPLPSAYSAPHFLLSLSLFLAMLFLSSFFFSLLLSRLRKYLSPPCRVGQNVCGSEWVGGWVA